MQPWIRIRNYYSFRVLILEKIEEQINKINYFQIFGCEFGTLVWNRKCLSYLDEQRGDGGPAVGQGNGQHCRGTEEAAPADQVPYYIDIPPGGLYLRPEKYVPLLLKLIWQVPVVYM